MSISYALIGTRHNTRHTGPRLQAQPTQPKIIRYMWRLQHGKMQTSQQLPLPPLLSPLPTGLMHARLQALLRPWQHRPPCRPHQEQEGLTAPLRHGHAGPRLHGPSRLIQPCTRLLLSNSQPESPARPARFHCLTHQPVCPPPTPVRPTHQPARPTHQPVRPTHQPVRPTHQPVRPPHQPAHTSPNSLSTYPTRPRYKQHSPTTQTSPLYDSCCTTYSMEQT